MRAVCIITVCFLAVTSSFDGDDEITKHSKLTNYNYFVRCTRRYTPGLCIEPVVSVWTFVFQLQNCTERYGCNQDWRTNRFTTYDRCMRRCKSLMDLYAEILSRDPHNLTAYVRDPIRGRAGRRHSGDEDDNGDVDKEDDYILSTQIHFKGPGPDILKGNDDQPERELTADIDEAHLEIPANSEYHDYIHDPINTK